MGVLNRMSAGSDSALVQQCFKGWVEMYMEVKKANELQDMLDKAGGKFGSFNERNKAGAKNATERAALLQDEQVYLIIMLYWKRHVKCERMRAYAKERNNKKKQQLLGVKGLFKNFANELESGLKQGTPLPSQSRQIAPAPAEASYDPA